MTLHEGLLVLHILGAAGWIGGGLFGWFSQVQLARNASSSGRALHTLAERADRFFGPVVGLTLLTGIALVWTQDAWGWSDTFVLMGIGAIVFSALFQPLVSSKDQERLLAAVERGQAGAEIKASNRTAAIEMTVLLVVLWAMVAKLGA